MGIDWTKLNAARDDRAPIHRPQGRHYGIEAEPIEIKADLTPVEVLKTALRRAGSYLVWRVKILLRFRVR